MKTDIEKIEAILKAVDAVTFTDGTRTTAKLQDEWFLSSLTFDRNAIHELELLVIEKFGRLKYGTELFRVTGIDAMSLFSFDSTLAVIGTTSTADAATRIAAMLAAIEEAGK